MKKAIIEASFGTSYKEALDNSVLALKKTFDEEFPEYEVFTAITSGRVLSALKKQGVLFDALEEMLFRLKSEGFDEVIVQPTHLIPGIEYDKLCGQIKPFEKDFSVLKTGTTLFNSESDIEKVCRIIAEKYLGEIVILMGHGTEHNANNIYVQFGVISNKLGYDNIYTATVEAEPMLEDVMNKLKGRGIKKVSLVPLMLVAGDHARNDMAGDSSESWKSRLESAGFEVNCVIKGLGEYSEIRQIYCEHLKNTIKS
ncbi:MAG: sirohydrochlorin cobaltochelatase [Oscillospiraceae bacterium]